MAKAPFLIAVGFIVSQRYDIMIAKELQGEMQGEMQGGMRMELEKLELPDLQAAERALMSVGADPRGVAIMKEKAVFRVVKVEGVPIRAANLIKQTFLAHGAEAAVSRKTASFSAEKTDMILMGTLAQYRAILARLREQPFGLRELSEALEKFLRENS